MSTNNKPAGGNVGGSQNFKGEGVFPTQAGESTQASVGTQTGAQGSRELASLLGRVRVEFLRLCGYRDDSKVPSDTSTWVERTLMERNQQAIKLYNWGYEPAFIAKCLWEQEVDGVKPTDPLD